MPFDWNEYYLFAENLSKEIPTGNLKDQRLVAIARVCVSRYYYAAHWYCRKFLKDKYKTEVGQHDCHGVAITYMLKHDSKASKTLGRMKDRRNDADYESEEYFSRTDATDAHDRYNEIKKLVDNLYSK